MKTHKAPACLLIAAVFLALTTYRPAVCDAASRTLAESEITSLLNAGEPVFARIFTAGTLLFADDACRDGLFTLPETYYLRVRDYAPDVCRVTYCYEDYDYARSVTGFARTEELTFVSDPPTGRSFPTVFPEFEGNGVFYKNNRFDSFYAAADSGAANDAFFYGYYAHGTATYCYVLCGGKFGYYSADVFGKIDIPPHPDPRPQSGGTEPAPPAESESSGGKAGGFFKSDANKVVFIAVSCILAVGVTYLIFLPRKRREPLPGEDEDD